MSDAPRTLGEVIDAATNTASETAKRLTLYPPKDEATAHRMDSVRGALISTGSMLEAFCPPGRELSLALTKIEEACYWAIGAIARNQDITEHIATDDDGSLRRWR